MYDYKERWPEYDVMLSRSFPFPRKCTHMQTQLNLDTTALTIFSQFPTDPDCMPADRHQHKVCFLSPRKLTVYGFFLA